MTSDPSGGAAVRPCDQEDRRLRSPISEHDGRKYTDAQAVQYLFALFLIFRWTIQGQLAECRIEKVTIEMGGALKLIRRLLDAIFGQLSFCHPAIN